MLVRRKRGGRERSAELTAWQRRPTVAGVVGVAPRLPDGDPVEQLRGRRVLIVHGDRDRTAAGAAKSLDCARRARTVVPRLARYEVPRGSHYPVRRADDVWALTTASVLSMPGTGSFPAGAGGDLRTPLPQRS
ncbi:alpha/beta hydrolase [Saccharothrix sp. ST-888]|uniref:alpha/beta hydrolase n=1 Tax=Saccharothrix sp. ST-888 TaxID=1427391 RepID=UPI000696C149|nr:alpha/beta hydrolase [Saccharothrix sp. ST-888]